MRYAALPLATLLSFPLGTAAQVPQRTLCDPGYTCSSPTIIETGLSTGLILSVDRADYGYGISASTRADATRGALFWARGGRQAVGLDGAAELEPDGRMSVAIGVSGYAESNEVGDTVYGVFGFADYGAGSSTDAYAGYFLGNVAHTGDLLKLSSIRLKQDVQPLRGRGVLDRVRQLRPVSFAYRPGAIGGPPGRHYGVIAEEVRAVFPEVVSDVRHVDAEPPAPDTPNASPPELVTTTYAAVDYDELVALLMQAIQDQQEQIEALTERVERLERRP